MASNAASMAASITDLPAAATSISTKVPRSGLARRMLSDTTAIGGQNSLHAFGDMGRGQRCARDVPDIAVDLQGAATGLANELGEPARAPDIAAIGFPILQDFHLLDSSGWSQRHRVVDEEVLADDS